MFSFKRGKSKLKIRISKSEIDLKIIQVMNDGFVKESDTSTKSSRVVILRKDQKCVKYIFTCNGWLEII